GDRVDRSGATATRRYAPTRESFVSASEYAVPYLARIAETFGLGDRWAYRRTFTDGEWLGPRAAQAERVLAKADAVLSITGSTRLAEEHIEVGRLVYVGTDPVQHEVAFGTGDPDVVDLVGEH